MAALLALTTACGEEVDPIPPACVGPLEIGGPIGHADPFGARAAGEARAARIDDASLLPPPAHGRQPIKDGDYVLVNEHIAVIIEGARVSDGYGRFGGEILAIDGVGEDGMPLGLSRYGETLLALGLTTVDPSSVTVLSDGSDGGAAIVRVAGTTQPIPFVASSLGALFEQYSLQMAIDFVLEPGAEKLGVRYAVVNASPASVDFGEGSVASDELYGFFHTNQNQVVTPEKGFDTGGAHDWVGFVSDDWSFAWRTVDGPINYGLDVSGFHLFHAPGFVADGCAITTLDRSELFAGGPDLDGLREAMRRSDGAEPWRAIEGTVEDATGAPVAEAWVHALDEDDLYLSRVKSGADGTFTIHVPPGAAATLVAQKRGWPLLWQPVAAAETTTTLALAPHGIIAVQAEDDAGTPLPVRVQVVPATPVEGAPPHFGVIEEQNGRLHQEFATSGEANLVVPPGEHRVIVSRGYEYEIVDTTVTVAAGETVDVPAVLAHSVDSSDVMCADFHIHSFLSADSSDPIVHKVKGAVADGLDIPVSSEHEWVLDFGPVVSELGLEAWAFGSSSSELTTFTYGHFGVVPLRPRPGTLNNGAIDWIGKTPAEVFAAVDEREEKPVLVVNHPRSTGIGGYFSAAKLDQSGHSTSDLWSDNFDAIEVFNDSDFEENRKGTVHDWFQFLAQGKRIVAVGNSDSHHLRTSPAGYPRTCFYFGHDDPQALSDLLIRDAVLSGDSVVSGGLFMTVSGPGGAHPGASLSPGSATFSLVVQSPSWIGDATEIEVIVSGTTVDTVALTPSGAGPGKRYEASVTLDLTAGDFVVFHVAAEGDLAPVHPGRRPFAVSNPFFVE